MVILAEVYPTENQDMNAVLYVGCSRARNHLMVLASSDIAEALQAKLNWAIRA